MGSAPERSFKSEVILNLKIPSQDHMSLLLVQCGSIFTYGVPLVKGLH